MPYVYTHTRLDKNEVFYVGIGLNHNTHQRAYRKEGTSYWKKIVNKTEYRVEIVYDKVSWEEACELERDLILRYGRRDLGTGTLVNMTDGGEGSPGRIKSEEELEKIRGERNGSFGKCWIMNSNEEKLVKKEDLEKFFQEGWKRGRIISEEQRSKISAKNRGKKLSTDHKTLISGNSRGRVWITNGEKDMYVQYSDLERYLSSGWKKGRNVSEITKQKMSKTRKGRIWMRKAGEKDFAVPENLLSSFLENGWERGRTRRPKSFQVPPEKP